MTHPRNIVKHENERARRILAAHLGVPLHTIQYRGGDYLMVDNRQAYVILKKEFTDGFKSGTLYSIEAFNPSPVTSPVTPSPSTT